MGVFSTMLAMILSNFSENCSSFVLPLFIISRFRVRPGEQNQNSMYNVYNSLPIVEPMEREISGKDITVARHHPTSEMGLFQA